jgi:hypothetical protein
MGVNNLKEILQLFTPLRKPSKLEEISTAVAAGPYWRRRIKESVRVRYGTGEIPMTGDRIQDAALGMGTVTAISLPATGGPEPSHVSVKWDEGIIEIDYDTALRFALVARNSTRTARR